ncbi:hypothetical protein [Haliangium sp.]|uniref:hypothetical protein n=1 Tax=Haliangium sp. TaxID=2663208 RepID=UPI003D14ADD3
MNRSRLVSQMRCTLTPVAALAVAGLLLSGCGDDGGGGGTPDARPPDAAPAPDAADTTPDASLAADSSIDAPAGLGYDIYLPNSTQGFTFESANLFTDNGDSTYTLTYALTTANSPLGFKVADDGFSDDKTWSAPEVGGARTVTLDTAVTLEIATGFGTDSTLTIATDGDYVFTVDATDPTAPTLTVSLSTAAR